MNRIKKTGLFAGLAATAVSTLVLFGAPNGAQAAINPTCDAARLTVHMTDSQTGAPLANATESVTMPQGVFGLAGDQMSKQSDFRAAFDGPNGVLGKRDTQNWNTYLAPASQEVLGTDPVQYPQDPRNVSDPDAATQEQQQQQILSDMFEDPSWNAFKNDVQTRHDAIYKVIDFLNTIQQGSDDVPDFLGDSAYVNQLWDAATTTNIELAVIRDMENNKTDYNTVSADYTKLIDPSNWTFGTSLVPNQELFDWVDTNNASGASAWVSAPGSLDVLKATEANANAAAAQTIGATNTLSLTTDDNGDAVFTVFEAATGVWTSGTRGNTDCSQLSASFYETQQPDGYRSNYLGSAHTYSVASDSTAQGTTTVVNDPIPIKDTTPGGTTDVAPPTTNTGL